MCTTYTWMAYQRPGPQAPQPSQPPQHLQQAQRRGRGVAAMPTCSSIREEDDDEVDECPAAARPRRPRRARHWVGLAIVGVQMAAWCLVGALLMHRGVTNLKRRDAAASALAASAPPPALDDGLVPGTTPPPWLPRQAGEAADAAETGEVADDEGPPSTPDATSPNSEVPPIDKDADAEAYPESGIPDLMRRWSSFVPVRPVPGLVAPRDETLLPPAVGPGPGSAPGRQTGAATAVVMVTVGGVMLVVGPAFMAIKIMDVYQRQKRLSKLSRHDDPPPSYDEVAEKAPRYSALFQVLENGELTPLSLEVPMVAMAAVPSAPEGEAAVGDDGPDSEPTAADHRGDGQQDQEQEAEAEVDALTPLRHLEAPRKPEPCDDDKSRRRSV